MTALLAAAVVAAAADVAGSGRVAMVTADGSVLASIDGGAAWAQVHRCPAPPAAPPDATYILDTGAETGFDPEPCPADLPAMAWRSGELLFSCDGDEVWRWAPDSGPARSTGQEAMCLAAPGPAIAALEAGAPPPPPEAAGGLGRADLRRRAERSAWMPRLSVAVTRRLRDDLWTGDTHRIHGRWDTRAVVYLTWHLGAGPSRAITIPVERTSP